VAFCGFKFGYFWCVFVFSACVFWGTRLFTAGRVVLLFIFGIIPPLLQAVRGGVFGIYGIPVAFGLGRGPDFRGIGEL